MASGRVKETKIVGNKKKQEKKKIKLIDPIR